MARAIHTVDYVPHVDCKSDHSQTPQVDLSLQHLELNMSGTEDTHDSPKPYYLQFKPRC